MLSKHFSDKELACPLTGKAIFAHGFIEALEQLRKSYNTPMWVNSCCRSAEYNRSIGGHVRSLHVYDVPFHPTAGCCAIDIHMPDGKAKGKLLQLAWVQGWSIGVGKQFLHLDRRLDVLKMPSIVFTY